MKTHTLTYYKARAGAICDMMLPERPEQSLPPSWAASMILAGRRTNGFRSSVMMGCVVGALIERGHPDKAEAVIKEIASYAEFSGAALPVDLD